MRSATPSATTRPPTTATHTSVFSPKAEPLVDIDSGRAIVRFDATIEQTITLDATAEQTVTFDAVYPDPVVTLEATIDR